MAEPSRHFLCSVQVICSAFGLTSFLASAFFSPLVASLLPFFLGGMLSSIARGIGLKSFSTGLSGEVCPFAFGGGAFSGSPACLDSHGLILPGTIFRAAHTSRGFTFVYKNDLGVSLLRIDRFGLDVFLGLERRAVSFCGIFRGEWADRVPELRLGRHKHRADAVFIRVADAKTADETLELSTALVMQRDAYDRRVVCVKGLQRKEDSLVLFLAFVPNNAPVAAEELTLRCAEGSTTIADSIEPGIMS